MQTTAAMVNGNMLTPAIQLNFISFPALYIGSYSAQAYIMYLGSALHVSYRMFLIAKNGLCTVKKFTPMKVKFKVKYDDAVKELSVASNTTVDEFIASARLANIVPRVGIRNIVVRDQSSDLSASDCLVNVCRSECLSVDWDECDGHVARLCEMGFLRENVVAALHEAGNQVESAVDKLIHVDASGNCLSFDMSAGVMGDLSDRSDVPCQSTRISQLSNGSCADMNLVASFKLAAD